ncbi:uncharacterized protein LOC133893484 [Phragmites australis]|uniref:uncharacterized protein LOC133893484 n=1 Tax=Phragmites australis TaxID=29695 RepID=UPI002D79F732|nr:uncharacterized protein LOC133893484 [Phragmites australis]
MAWFECIYNTDQKILPANRAQQIVNALVFAQKKNRVNFILSLIEIVMDGGSLGDTSFRDTRSEAVGIDTAAGDSPRSPGMRRSRRHRSRGSATSSMDCTGGETTEKKEKGKKGTRKNRKKDKDKPSAGDDAAADGGSSATCQDLPAVPKKSNRRKNKGSSEAATKEGPGAAPEEGPVAPLPQVDEDKDREW